MYLQLIFFFLKSRIFKQLLISCFTTVSDKNSWDTLTKRCFFLLVLPLSLSKSSWKAEFSNNFLFHVLLQSQTKIAGTLQPNAVFFLLVLPSSLSKLFIAVRSPNFVHQHWGHKDTQSVPTILTETVVLDVRDFLKKVCASKVLRDGYGNLIRSGEPQVSVTLSYGEEKLNED